jgi:hypothetical protein
MFLAGLWHGAGWNYVAWGLLHGTYLVLQRMVSKPFQTVCKVVRCPAFFSNLIAIFTVFLLTCIAWVFFRAGSLDRASYMLKAIFSWEATAHLSFGGMKFQLLRVFVVLCVVFLVDFLSNWQWIQSKYKELPYVRVVFAGLLVLLIIFTGNFASNSFIYFQF